MDVWQMNLLVEWMDRLEVGVILLFVFACNTVLASSMDDEVEEQ